VAGLAAEARFELRPFNIVMAGGLTRPSMTYFLSKPDVDAQDIRAKARFALQPGHDEKQQRPGAIPAFFHYTSVIVREGGRCSIRRLLDSIRGGGDYWMPAFAA
jgi:hypothetical protein